MSKLFKDLTKNENYLNHKLNRNLIDLYYDELEKDNSLKQSINKYTSQKKNIVKIKVIQYNNLLRKELKKTKKENKKLKQIIKHLKLK